MRVIVVGGGIGGLATGVALRKEGFDALVIEQAPALLAIGAGLGFGANAMRALDYLGVGDLARELAIDTQAWIYRSLSDDRELQRIPLGEQATRKYGETYYSLHRANVIDPLIKSLPPECLRLGARVSDVEERPEGIGVTLESGEEIRGDVLVGADGLKSVVRTTIFGEQESLFTGLIAWRTVIPNEFIPEVAALSSLVGWMGENRFVVTYPVSKSTLNLSAYVPANEVHRESWTASGDVADLRKSFAGACAPVAKILSQVQEAFLTGIHFRPPLATWSTQRVALVGDSAHAMGPFSGNGAAFAIEDAVTLAICLRRLAASQGVEAALTDYSRRRIPRVNRAMTAARARSIHAAIKDPALTHARDGRMRGLGRLDPTGELDWAWLYGFDPIKSAQQPLAELGSEFHNPMHRSESQRAFDLWRNAIQPSDHAGSWLAERAAYERFMLRECVPSQAMAVEELDCDGIAALRVVPPLGEHGPIVLHLHGGGFAMGSARAAVDVAGRWAQALGGWALVPDYRLAPEHPYPAALEDALRAYRWLAANRKQPIFVTGEGAGGALALSLVTMLRDAGQQLPDAIHIVSPLCDLSLSAPSIDANTAREPWLQREFLTSLAASYLHDTDPRLPLVSPLYANLKTLPPLLIHAAADEALRDDAVRLAHVAKQAGLDVEIELLPDTVHSFVLFDFLPEARQALAQFAAFVASRQALPMSAGVH